MFLCLEEDYRSVAGVLKKKLELLSESTVIMMNCLIKYVLLKLCLVSSIPRLRVENES